MAHIPHTHILPDGIETGVDRVVGGGRLHDHSTPGRGRTSSDPYGKSHTHTIGKAETGGPMDVKPKKKKK